MFPASVTWRAASAAPPRVLFLDGAAREEQQVAEVLDSVIFQPWSSRNSLGTQQLQKQSRPPVVPRTKVDRWINPAARKLDPAAKEVAQPSGDAGPRDDEGAESSAAKDSAQFPTTAVPLVSEDGARYQRLPINCDLQLYWARVLRQKGQLDQAVTLLKQVLSSLPSPIPCPFLFPTHGAQTPRMQRNRVSLRSRLDIVPVMWH